MIERFCFRLAAHHRIARPRLWMRKIRIDEIVDWVAYWNVEPFGDDWNRTAMQTLFLLKALGASVDETFLEAFLPNYDPNRAMTNEELEEQIERFKKRTQNHRIDV